MILLTLIPWRVPGIINRRPARFVGGVHGQRQFHGNVLRALLPQDARALHLELHLCRRVEEAKCVRVGEQGRHLKRVACRE